MHTTSRIRIDSIAAFNALEPTNDRPVTNEEWDSPDPTIRQEARMRWTAQRNAEYDRVKSWDERRGEAEWHLTLIPRARFESSRPMATRLLHCGLFNISNNKTAREDALVEFFPVSSGGWIAYTGPELRQSDESVLLHLLWLRNGRTPAGEPVRIDPRQVCAALRWADSKHSVKRLKACLLRMKDADINYYDKYGELQFTTGLIHEIDFEQPQWEIELSRKLAWGMWSSTSTLNANVRAKLKEGLATWLYGFISGNDCKREFSLAILHEFSGSKASTMKEFGRSVRDALEDIKEAGGLVDYDARRGIVWICKHPRPMESE